MEKFSSFRRNSVAIAGVSLIAAPLAVMATPAFAVADACTAVNAGATEVLPGVCELQFVEAGDFTFTAPSGVAKLSAVIVGAGGGSLTTLYDAYAGGGGEVIFVQTVDVSAPVEIEVGLGSDGSTASGGSSSVNDKVAAGGFSGTYDGVTNCTCGGYSGNGNAGWDDMLSAAGGGAGGAAPDQFSGGPGLTASEAADESSMWPAVSGEDSYGAGGNMVTPGALTKTPGSGADTSTPAGEDGLVILRWTSASGDSGALVNTGLTSWGVALGAMFAIGLFFVATGAFRAKNDLQFAGSRARLLQLMRVADARLKRAEEAHDDDQIKG
jgi:hypothetical protein